MSVTDLATRQIRDGAVTNVKVAAGAAIATTKLADGAEFLKRNGSVVMTGALDMNSNLINNVTTPSASTDAATKGYVDTQIAGLNAIFDAKGSVRVATTAAGTLATSFENGDTIDGIVLATGDRILIKTQASQLENGIYIVAASGSPTRALDMDAWTEVPGAFVAVEQGTVNADTVWLCTANAGGTINTTAITWQQIPTSAGYTTANFIDKEIPSGSINGSNTAFTLANTPTAGSEHLYYNGVLLESGGGNDYTISGAAITMLFTPDTGDKLRASYRI